MDMEKNPTKTQEKNISIANILLQKEMADLLCSLLQYVIVARRGGTET